ncbi:hypothetical protein FGB62_135g02 [Gracilaria domingensis]|nr:hypothetical protein FGB62_135g02 [Gracilaria domingensis]
MVHPALVQPLMAHPQEIIFLLYVLRGLQTQRKERILPLYLVRRHFREGLSDSVNGEDPPCGSTSKKSADPPAAMVSRSEGEDPPPGRRREDLVLHNDDVTASASTHWEVLDLPRYFYDACELDGYEYMVQFCKVVTRSRRYGMNVRLRYLRYKKKPPGCSSKAAFMAKALGNQRAGFRLVKQKRMEAVGAAIKKNAPSTLSIPFVTFMALVDKVEYSNKPQTANNDGGAKVTRAKKQCKAQDVDVGRIAGSDSEDFMERIPNRFTRTLSWLQTDWSSRRDGHGERRGSDPAVVVAPK